MIKLYRPCVVAVIRNSEGLVLAGERSDQAGAWQLPQGGIDPGETADQAVFRELQEEIGTNRVRLLKRSETLIRYDFPASMQREQLKKFVGQEQQWYLFELESDAMPDLTLADGEFSNLRWQAVSTLMENVIEWKRGAYREGFSALGWQ